LVLEFFANNELCKNLAPEFVVSMLVDNEINWLANLLQNRNPTKEDFKQIYQLSAVEIVSSLDPNIVINHNESPLWELSA